MSSSSQIISFSSPAPAELVSVPRALNVCTVDADTIWSDDDAAYAADYVYRTVRGGICVDPMDVTEVVSDAMADEGRYVPRGTIERMARAEWAEHIRPKGPSFLLDAPEKVAA